MCVHERNNVTVEIRLTKENRALVGSLTLPPTPMVPDPLVPYLSSASPSPSPSRSPSRSPSTSPARDQDRYPPGTYPHMIFAPVTPPTAVASRLAFVVRDLTQSLTQSLTRAGRDKDRGDGTLPLHSFLHQPGLGRQAPVGELHVTLSPTSRVRHAEVDLLHADLRAEMTAVSGPISIRVGSEDGPVGPTERRREGSLSETSREGGQQCLEIGGWLLLNNETKTKTFLALPVHDVHDVHDDDRLKYRNLEPEPDGHGSTCAPSTRISDVVAGVSDALMANGLPGYHVRRGRGGRSSRRMDDDTTKSVQRLSGPWPTCTSTFGEEPIWHVSVAWCSAAHTDQLAAVLRESVHQHQHQQHDHHHTPPGWVHKVTHVVSLVGDNRAKATLGRRHKRKRG